MLAGIVERKNHYYIYINLWSLCRKTIDHISSTLLPYAILRSFLVLSHLQYNLVKMPRNFLTLSLCAFVTVILGFQRLYFRIILNNQRVNSSDLDGHLNKTCFRSIALVLLYWFHWLSYMYLIFFSCFGSFSAFCFHYNLNFIDINSVMFLLWRSYCSLQNLDHFLARWIFLKFVGSLPYQMLTKTTFCSQKGKSLWSLIGESYCCK